MQGSGNIQQSIETGTMCFKPQYGVNVPEIDFHEYNRERSGSMLNNSVSLLQIFRNSIMILYVRLIDIQHWYYPRGNLIYMRELGEGQFGKVLLMKAKVNF